MSGAVALTLTDVCDAAGEVVAPGWLLRAEPVHRQLRPGLPSDYGAKMRRVFAGGARMSVAVLGEQVAGLAVWRVFENTFEGVKFYVDDLITDQAHRSSGIGKALLASLEAEARKRGADALVLDSGTQRLQAHRFFCREGFVITSFNFKKQLV